MFEKNSTGKKVRMIRCHWCATTWCSEVGKRQIKEEGCADYTILEPMLRPRKWEGKRRIRLPRTAHISQTSFDFLELLKESNEHRLIINGYRTRAALFCIDMWLDKLDGAIPVIGERADYADFPLKLLLPPATDEVLQGILAYYKARKKEKVTLSLLVDYFITLTRESVELGKARSGCE